MEEARESAQGAVNAVFDALKYLGDASYAVLPRDIAHGLGDFKKAVLSNVRSLIDWEIDWVEERVVGGDRLREEWQQACKREADSAPSEAAGPAS
ncbi:MAG TPA: hypothetical protein VN920_13105 [Pyrinomonadaceae bacterium]|nr:hypothetical protein [Pyrinomonadaceae bacterium]